jgi:RNA polymerase sigma factor (sigma-70 family)
MTEKEQANMFMDQAEYWARQFCPVELRDDACGYAALSYVKLSESWDPEKSSWKTYCSNAIRNQIINFMKKETVDRERFHLLYDDYELVDMKFKLLIHMNSNHPLDDLIEKEELEHLQFAIGEATKHNLNERQKAVLWSRLLTPFPMTQQQLADMYEVSQPMIVKDEETIIKILREEMNYDISSPENEMR